MLKKILNGVAFGAGFTVVFIVILEIYAEYIFKPRYEREILAGSTSPSPSRATVDVPPVLPKKATYLGPKSYYSPDFKLNKAVDLSAGPGIIVGSAHLNNKPLANLKLRLALNGTALSEWTETDKHGQYTVRVPFGEYRIDGFRFDSAITDSILAGKIENPVHNFKSGYFNVSEDTEGRGTLFRFVSPIEITVPKKRYRLNEPVKFHWSAHPGADNYIIQVLAKPDPYKFFGSSTLFRGWSNQPMTSETSFTLEPEKHGLKPGLFYNINVRALKNKNKPISKSATKHSGYDFEIAN